MSRAARKRVARDRAARASAGHDERYRRALVRFGATWLALLALLAASAATALWHGGIGNLVASTGIALLKCALVAWVYMGLREASAPPRAAAAIGAFALLLLAALSLVDVLPRRALPDAAAAWQQPQRIAPVLAQAHGMPRTSMSPSVSPSPPAPQSASRPASSPLSPSPRPSPPPPPPERGGTPAAPRTHSPDLEGHPR